MASNTARFNLLKKDPATDGNDNFNIETMLNQNWDKVDLAAKKTELDELEQKAINYVTTTNTGNSYSATFSPAFTALYEGLRITVKINADSTGNCTINPNGLGTISMLKSDGSNVKNLKANGVYTFVYNGTAFILQGEAEILATTSEDGFMSSSDKSKLDSVATNANNYTHPASHPPSIITQDSNNRFVTDAEKTTWNNKVTSVAGKTGTVTLVKSDVGLGNVDNVKQVPITRTVNGKALSTDITISKPDVGLGSVENYSIASQAEAEAGASAVKYMTPQRAKQAIDAQIKNDLLPNFNFAYEEDYTYDVDGNITVVDYSFASVLRRKDTITYNLDGTVNTVNAKVYASNGTTIVKEYTDTITYTGDNITNIARSVIV